MNNGFKDYFGLNYNLEFNKVYNDYNNTSKFKFKRSLLIISSSFFSFLFLKFVYSNFLTNFEITKQNFKYWKQMRKFNNLRFNYKECQEIFNLRDFTERINPVFSVIN